MRTLAGLRECLWKIHREHGRRALALAESDPAGAAGDRALAALALAVALKIEELASPRVRHADEEDGAGPRLLLFDPDHLL